jgi:hypothetical protein
MKETPEEGERGETTKSTYLITTAMNLQLRSQHHAGDKGPKGRHPIEDQVGHHDGQALHHRGSDAVQHGDPAPDGDEDGVVDGARGATDALGDGIADEGGGEEDEEELGGAEAEGDEGRHLLVDRRMGDRVSGCVFFYRGV